MVKMAFLTSLCFLGVYLPTICQNMELFSFSLFVQNVEMEKIIS